MKKTVKTTKTSIATPSALAAIQAIAMKNDGMPAFLARQPGDAPPNRPMTAPKVPLSPIAATVIREGKKAAKAAGVFKVEQTADASVQIVTPKTVLIRIKAGSTFRGVKYFEAKELNVSPDLAKQAVTDGIAEKAPFVTKLPPAVAAGAYENGTEAERATGISKKRAAVGAKSAKPAAKKTAKTPSARKPGKGQMVIDMLMRKGGATMAVLSKATGWKPNSITSYVPSSVRGRYTIRFEENKKTGEKTYFAAPKKHRHTAA